MCSKQQNTLERAIAFCLEKDIDEREREFRAVKENQGLAEVHDLAEMASGKAWIDTEAYTGHYLFYKTRTLSSFP